MKKSYHFNRFIDCFSSKMGCSYSKATLLQAPQIPQKVGDLAEVKTRRQDFLNRIVQGNPLPARPKLGGGMYDSDLVAFDKLVNQVLKEALIAKACQKEYFIAFEFKNAANSARQLLNSDPRILAAGLTIKVDFIVKS